MNTKIGYRLGRIETELREIKREVYSLKSKGRFARAAGSWKNIDSEKLKKKIYASRKDTSRKVEF